MITVIVKVNKQRIMDIMSVAESNASTNPAVLPGTDASLHYLGIRRTSQLRRPWALAILLALLTGCAASTPPPPTEMLLNVEVAAADDINPDRTGRPSPLAISVFQLKSPDAFLKADFLSISDGSGLASGEDFINRENMTLRPGETRTLSVKLDDAAMRLGVIAEFRDIEISAWRAEAPIIRPITEASEKVVVDMRIVIDKTEVLIENDSKGE